MDLAKSFRKFFNYKRHYVVKELRSGKLKMAIGPCVIDEENEIYDESIRTDYFNNRYSVCVNCYSAKEAVEIAAQRIQVEKETKESMNNVTTISRVFDYAKRWGMYSTTLSRENTSECANIRTFSRVIWEECLTLIEVVTLSSSQEEAIARLRKEIEEIPQHYCCTSSRNGATTAFEWAIDLLEVYGLVKEETPEVLAPSLEENKRQIVVHKA